MDPPLPSEHCKGPVAVGRFVGHGLACGVFGMSLPGYVVVPYLLEGTCTYRTGQDPSYPLGWGCYGEYNFVSSIHRSRLSWS